MALVVTKFRGLLPALDRRQVDEPFVIDGRNFIFYAQGPVSAFGQRFYSYKKIVHPEVFQTFFINGKLFVFIDNAVLHEDVTLDTFAPAYTFPQNLELSPWTVAFVGGMYYFAKKGSGLLQHNPVTDSWQTIVDANIPTGLVAVTQSAGRLILLGQAAVAYSAIDDGTDLTPDAGDTGAGFQLTAIAGGGDPIAVKEVSQGFITYMRGGMMFSQSIEADVPFRHLPLATNTIPVSPFAIVDVDKRSHVLMSNTGLYIVSSAEPQIWQALMSEYLTSSLFGQVSPNNLGAYRLFYDQTEKLFFISVAENELFQFDRALVLYLPRDEWGAFNFPHSQIFNLFPKAVSHFGHFDFEDIGIAVPLTELCYLGTDRYVREIRNISGVEMFEETPYMIFNQQEPAAVHAILSDGVWRFSVFAQGLSFDASTCDHDGLCEETEVELIDPETLEIDEETELPVVEGNEPFDDDTLYDDDTGFYDYPQLGTICGVSTGFIQTQIMPYVQEFGQLHSEVTLGIFRMGDEQHIDRTYSIYDLTIGVSDPSGEQSIEDWMLLTGQEDWNTLEGMEDWGEGLVGKANFSAESIALADGYNVFQDQVIDLSAVILHDDNRRFRYTPSANLFYAAIRVSTEEVDNYYEIKTTESNTLAEGIMP